VAAVALAVAVALSGCSQGSAPSPTGTPETLPPPTESAELPGEPVADPAFERFYAQTAAWEACGEELECTTVTVPVDWEEPGGETLDLAVVRRPATDEGARIGSLLYNPGGPGASGTQLVELYGEQLVTREVLARYDLVGFDPRGVGDSAPVDCLDDAELDDYLAYDVEAETDEGLDDLTEEAQAFADGCAASAGPLLAHLGTPSAARDMDVLRAALGEERLTYLGKSYGTLLGAHYAGQFPQRVGRLVLDGALDPSNGYDDVLLGQAGGLELALRSYLQACLDGDTSDECPVRGSVDQAAEQVQRVIAQAEEQPLPTGTDRELTVTLAVSGIITPLYEDASWPVLDEALAAALVGDGEPLLRLADLYADRNEDGTYASNLLEAFTAINCLDYAVDDSPDAMRALEDRLAQESPTFGRFLAFGETTCGLWPEEPVRAEETISASGAPPILVVGTTGDPATPYEWSVALAEQLESGRLLTWEGEGHTAYARGSRCVDAAVDGYLLDGVLPGEGATCAR
jgi:pimeloyl-ACP methyl ester carboxylesterase